MQQPNLNKFPPGRRGCLYVLMTLLMGALMLYIVTKPRGIEPKPHSTGPSASWDTILATAEGATYKIDKDALLDTIGAGIPDYGAAWTLTNSLEVTFSFWRPIGDAIHVTLEDAAPTSTLNIDAEPKGNRGIGADRYRNLSLHKQELDNGLGQIKLSPREAVEKTWAEVNNYARQQGITNPHPKPTFITVNLFGKPVAWRITYAIADPRVPTPDSKSESTKIYPKLVATYSVNTQTGEISNREYRDNRNESPVVIP